jgi:hypothetical protein
LFTGSSITPVGGAASIATRIISVREGSRGLPNSTFLAHYHLAKGARFMTNRGNCLSPLIQFFAVIFATVRPDRRLTAA